MGFDPVSGASSGPNSAYYEQQKKQIDENRAKELEQLQTHHREELEKAKVIRANELRQVSERESEVIKNAQERANTEMEHARSEAESRIQKYAEDTAKMTEDGRKQFQKKLDNLSTSSREIEKQRQQMLSQNYDSMQRLRAEAEQSRQETQDTFHRQADQYHSAQTKNLRELSDKGEFAIRQTADQYKMKLANEKAEGDFKIANLRREKELQTEQVRSDINFSHTAAEAQLKDQKTREQELRTVLDEKYADELQRQHDHNRTTINTEMIRGRKKAHDTKEYFETEAEMAARKGRKDILDTRTQTQSSLDALENDAKAKEIVARQTYTYQKEKLDESRQRNIKQFEAMNKASKDNLTQEYEKRQHEMKDTFDKQAIAQFQVRNKELADERKQQTAKINAFNNANTEKLGAYAKKQEDPFYRVHSTLPQMSEGEKHYQIRIAVPEHEADTLRLTAQKGTLSLTGSRRAEVRTTNPDGHVITTNSYQSFTESFPIQSAPDMKRMTRSYENGMLTFTIPKV